MSDTHVKFEDAISALSADLRAAARALRVRSDCSKAIIRAQSEKELLDEICRIIADTGGYKMIWIGYAEDEKEKIVRLAAGIGIDPDYMNALRLGWGDDERGQGLTGQAVRTGKPAVARRIPTDPSVAEWRRKDAVERGYASGIVLPLVSAGRVIGVMALNSAFPDAFDPTEAELLAALADDVAFGITALREREARIEAEKALLSGREVLLTLINNIPDTIFYKDSGGRYIFANAAKVNQAKNYSPVDIIGKTVWDLYPEEQARVFAEEDRATLNGELGISVWEEKMAARDGNVEWRLNTKVPVRGPQGEPAGLITIGRDITEQKRAEELLRLSIRDKETLLLELRHRVKNNLALVSSLLNLGMNELSDDRSRDVFMSARNRLHSIVALYEHLDRSENLNDVALHVYIKDLAEALFSTYAPEPGRIDFSLRLAEAVIDTRRSIPLGLILNELLTNALKYAFPGNRSGKVSVVLENTDGNAALIVSDDGAGLPEGYDSDTSPRLGLKLVRLLTDQIRGNLTFSGGAGRGTTARLTFTLQEQTHPGD